MKFEDISTPWVDLQRFFFETQKYFWTVATEILGALHFTKYTLFIKRPVIVTWLIKAPL